MSGGSVYEIGMRMTLAGNAAGALAGIIAQMGHIHQLEGKIEKGFHSWNAAIIGAGVATVGAGVLKMAGHFEQAGEKLAHAQNILAASLPDASRAMDMQIAKTSAYAEAGRNLNTTLADNITHLNDLNNVVQDMHESTLILPVFNDLQTAFDFVGTDKTSHARSAKNLADLARAFELAGRNTPEAMKDIGEEFKKTVIGLRGQVNGSMMFQALSSAQLYRGGYSDDFLTKGLPAMSNVMKGRLGTALNAIGSNLVGGTSSSEMQANFQEKWGLHKESDRLMIDGKFKGFKPGSLWHSQEATEDPLLWAFEFRKMLHDEKGVNVESTKEMFQVVMEISKGNKLLGGALGELLMPKTFHQLEKEHNKIAGVNLENVREQMEKDPAMWRKRLHDQWENFEESFGVALVNPFVNHILKPITEGLRDVSQWAIQNPETVKEIMRILVGVGAGLVALGGIMIGGALMAAIGPAGWLIAGMVALGAYFGTGGKAFASTGGFAAKAEKWGTKLKDSIVAKFNAIDWAGVWTSAKGIGSKILGGVGKLFESAFSGIEGWASSGGFGKALESMKAWATGSFLPWLLGSFTDDLYAFSVKGSQYAVRLAGVVFNMMADLGGFLMKEMAGLPGMVSSAISAAIAGIGELIKKAIGSFWSWGTTPLFGPHAGTPMGGAAEPAQQKQSYVPPAQTDKQSSTVIMQVDGQKIGEVAASYIGRSGTYPLSPSFNDSHGNFSLPAFN
ncbi:hypothetical protein [Methylosinus sp. PW1]|uniref:hypothetical protein n=1 Tax=Methylosinus sp. PW1 TaxID=107636 RepID=UPI000568CE7B|nr:hypothetical protein [Methylosinus sp. PW1]